MNRSKERPFLLASRVSVMLRAEMAPSVCCWLALGLPLPLSFPGRSGLCWEGIGSSGQGSLQQKKFPFQSWLKSAMVKHFGREKNNWTLLSLGVYSPPVLSSRTTELNPVQSVVQEWPSQHCMLMPNKYQESSDVSLFDLDNPYLYPLPEMIFFPDNMK